MIKVVIDLLNVGDYYGMSESVDFAKGRHQYPSTINHIKLLLKRVWKSKK